jgi:hypothetical protein
MPKTRRKNTKREISIGRKHKCPDCGKLILTLSEGVIDINLNAMVKDFRKSVTHFCRDYSKDPRYTGAFGR